MDDQNPQIQTNPAIQSKDQNVLSFMMQLVQERYGDEVGIEFLNSESDKLYQKFGDDLVSYFEPQLNDDQKKQFDQLIAGGKGQDDMLNFLLDAIPDLEEQIMQVLIQFRAEYLGQVAEGQPETNQSDQSEGGVTN